MSVSWELHLKYNKTMFVQPAVLEYSSKQIIRIRVVGKHGSVLLENDFPAIRFSGSKKGVKWKIRQGKWDTNHPESANLLVAIFSQLEEFMKRDFGLIYPDANDFLTRYDNESPANYLRRTKN